MPRVSFLLPVYNGATFLAETLTSLENQTMDDFDILVVDDGSTDHSAQVVADFPSTRIRMISQANAGLVSALNFGLKNLDCEFVARIDADDTSVPDRLAQQLDFMGFTGAVAVSGKAHNIDVSGNLLGVSSPEYDFHRADAGFIPAREPYLPHPFLTARLDVIQQLGGFRNAHLAEDSDLCWRLHEHYRIAIQPQIMGRYRIHQGSISANSVASLRIQAVFSQLASLNATRRDSDQPEVRYDLSIDDARTAAASVMGIIDLLSGLSSAEIRHLTAASALKLADLSNWRKAMLDKSDIELAQKALRKVKLSAENSDKIAQIFNAVRVRQPDLFARKWYHRT
ncbi:hypothetical protein GCM10007939_18230 [Amylibacter marinus]|uniref:Glycosyltransferase 2-like domain-containing protein n=1 Tax=Amylibacter marinus TaxID=1475483 RepID=A0ABQ5VVT0_9RHOB|nr:glycosyltransferase family 2 protein [Amylibacter marinus]GLQ35540.1 hypothetical protein GCM10007939_18230 [Amylibacter marinus]